MNDEDTKKRDSEKAFFSELVKRYCRRLEYSGPLRQIDKDCSPKQKNTTLN